jgi:hypothetical protein
MTAAPPTYRVSVGAANSTVSTNGAGYGGRIVTTGRFRYERTDDTGAGTGPTRSIDAALVAQIVTYITPGATASILVNNELTPDPNGASFDVGTITPDRCALFCYPDSVPDSFSDDRIGTALLFNTALDAPTRQQIVAWLMARWGI